MKPETEEAVQAAKGLLTELVIVASLVRALTDTFGSASDLYQKLKRKSSPRDSDDEDRFHISMFGRRRRDSGFGMSGSSKDLCESEGELIFTSSAQIRAEYDRGYRKIGESFARGDATAQIQLQSQIIQLQKVCLVIHQDLSMSSYIAPSSTHSHLVRLIQTTRTARAASMAALSMQYQRMLPTPSPSPRQPDPPFSPPYSPPCSPPGAFPDPEDTWHTTKPFKPRRRTGDSSSSSTSSEDKEFKILPVPNPISKPKPPAPKPEPDLKPKPKPDDKPTTKTRLFCIYAKELQDNPLMPLADAYKPCGDNKCPFCRTYLAMRTGKIWEIVVDDCRESRHLRRKPLYRVFRIKNRFIVKSHREQGGFACVLCARFRRFDMLCRDIGSLMDHLWREHTADELEWDCDILEC
ncbi:hypothetical protein COCMIDRAFT_89326 [Bipolaris oryzae ATCC 44560]|uniref:Uncharacterized protein n=1 Tax=Bipolaris oryzae ATCC 44560 TaxID=930090 RepID=W6ZVA7_COCMI|nr:uncharacterized protein COCMIDRAFT_89326 [Bipolaris oryzae ATCC 44560]EUC47696.1 hypothetical protein COCMIDRAFT_89326 [Bipolaris oryzae ATCC 44560]